MADRVLPRRRGAAVGAADAWYAAAGGERIGYLYVHLNGVISDLGVAPDFRRQGVATALLEDARDAIGRVFHDWDNLTTLEAKA